MSQSSFEFLSVPRIIFGPGKLRTLLSIIKDDFKKNKVIVIANGSDTIQKIEDIFKSKDKVNENDCGITYTLYRVKREPEVCDVDEVVKMAREFGAEAVVGIGGGSALDLAKAVSGLLTNDGNVLDYMEVIGKGKKITVQSAPMIAIPTTAGTGSEVTKNAVIALKEKNFKASIRSPLLMPNIALLDPEITYSLPAEVTARTGMDALTQCLEAFVSINSNPISDPLAMKGFCLAAKSLKKAVQVPTDGEARADMLLASLLGGITLANAGLGAVHGFAAPLGAVSSIPHGSICGALLAPVVRYNAANVAKDSVEYDKFVALGEAVHSMREGEGGEGGGGGKEAMIECLCGFIERLTEEIKIPGLSFFGFGQHDQNAELEKVAILAQKASSMKYNPIQIPVEDLIMILKKAL